ncbi:hypothetical protein HRR80_000603 [Exophiala dermatitidis]|uniref:Uncharacterized protein n=1 Tax=Exophiala dermatitidis TaxID=5970 RepID=A0AAN6IYA4_EXODE|nr:hypothetical protein HRR75_000547 [Exophiala dermatitidis]KAJ4527845.1 hypothetical protein HRR74_000600 [Exophiala dermatitidis]KAJ4529847.1 hypothetical protein HRR76_009099 [Exophiala dermatitidis]KAJ4558606.1 hypothetical protein HRR77_000598 [Exophiala dermatitidis]KAJ4590323.1 hypothetical protein HRR82_000684 [Exophiala dermatitidis]
MANDIFNCLIDDIEPHNNITWPPAIKTKLQELWKHFTGASVNPSNITDDEIEEVQAPLKGPKHGIWDHRI